MKYKIGDRVRKIKGSSWQGMIVGAYSTELTKVGYAVESEYEKGSVQIYPEAALELMTVDERPFKHDPMTNPDIEKKIEGFIMRFFVYDIEKNKPHGDHVGAEKTAADWLRQALTEMYEMGRVAGQDYAAINTVFHKSSYEKGAAEMKKRILELLPPIRFSRHGPYEEETGWNNYRAAAIKSIQSQ